MAELNPPFALQNAGATHTAEGDRMMVSGMFAAANVASSLMARGGINMGLGGAFQVTQQATPNMSVQVLSGVAFIPGTEGSKQGLYAVVNDGAENLTVDPAEATLTRIDSVFARVLDSQYSGADNFWELMIFKGTPGSSPSAPSFTAVPNALKLADIRIPAGKTSIVTSDITDTRRYLTAAGGIISCTSGTRPGLSQCHDGQGIFERDTGKLLFKRNNDWELKSATSPSSQSGSKFVSFSNKGSHTLGVTFPEAFASKPKVFTNINNPSGSTAGWQSRAYNVSTTGFTLFVYSDDNVNSTWSSVEVQWFASE